MTGIELIILKAPSPGQRWSAEECGRPRDGSIIDEV
jgi:hypothetical protein